MMADSPRESRYALSFTSGALLMREALHRGPYLREHDWPKGPSSSLRTTSCSPARLQLGRDARARSPSVWRS